MWKMIWQENINIIVSFMHVADDNRVHSIFYVEKHHLKYFTFFTTLNLLILLFLANLDNISTDLSRKWHQSVLWYTCFKDQGHNLCLLYIDNHLSSSRGSLM